jgi:hypothetical protein
MNESRDRVQGAKLFSKIDLTAGYNLIKIRASDEWKIAFRTRDGYYEYVVMLFGIGNASMSFRNMINTIFKHMIDLGILTYIDNIFIYSQTKEEHERLIKEVLSRLQNGPSSVNRHIQVSQVRNRILRLYDIRYGY